MTTFCDQRTNSRCSTIADGHLVTSLCLVMSYCIFLSFAANLTKIEDVLCVGTMRAREHNILLNGNQEKIVKALTCYLCSEVHPELLSSLRCSKGGFETLVSD